MVKSVVRSCAINIAAFHIASLVIPGLWYEGGLKTLFIVVLILGIMNVLIKPIVNLLLLPINVLTLGAFRWVVNVIVLFLLILVVNDIKIESFTFSGFQFRGFIIPEIKITTFFSLVLSSITISVINAFIIWLFREDI